jgi:hypothetical protein
VKEEEDEDEGRTGLAVAGHSSALNAPNSSTPSFRSKLLLRPLDPVRLNTFFTRPRMAELPEFERAPSLGRLGVRGEGCIDDPAGSGAPRSITLGPRLAEAVGASDQDLKRPSFGVVDATAVVKSPCSGKELKGVEREVREEFLTIAVGSIQGLTPGPQLPPGGLNNISSDSAVGLETQGEPLGYMGELESKGGSMNEEGKAFVEACIGAGISLACDGTTVGASSSADFDTVRRENRPENLPGIGTTVLADEPDRNSGLCFFSSDNRFASIASSCSIPKLTLRFICFSFSLAVSAGIFPSVTSSEVASFAPLASSLLSDALLLTVRFTPSHSRTP